MPAVVIVVVVLVVLIVVALAISNPMMRRREAAATDVVTRHLGAGSITLLEARTTAMGTDPEEAGGVRGMACVGLSAAELMAVTWVGGKQWRIPRAAITRVDTTTDDPAAVAKATIAVTFVRPDGGEATATFRLRDAADWLDELGFDWGDEDDDGEPLVDDGGADPDSP